MTRKLVLIFVVVLLWAGMLPVVQAQKADLRDLSGNFGISDDNYDHMPLLAGLADASGLFGKDPDYIAPKEQQTLGKYTGVASKGSYTLTLPDKPVARPFDLQGGTAGSGKLLVFDLRLMSDIANRGSMNPNEDVIASSLKISVDFRVEGGTLLVWTADNQESFPSSAGADKKLFTADDPKLTLPAGWSLVNLDSAPFKVSQEAPSSFDLSTTGLGDINDYSALSCADLIPTFLDRVQQYYPFTELHHVDWAAIRATMIPASKTAKTEADCEKLIRDFGNSVPDGHVDFSLPALRSELQGSVNLRLATTSDGQVVVVGLASGGPADKAGIKLGAVITEWDGKPIQQALKDQVLQFANSSTSHGLLDIQLTQLPYGTLGSTVKITFQNQGDAKPTSATLTRVAPARMAGTRAPVKVQDNKLDSGLGYLRINNFEDMPGFAAFDKAVDDLIAANVPGIIIDVRSNPGGFSQMSDAMASRFFDKSFIVGKDISDDGRLVYMMKVDPRLPVYKGCVAVLVDVNTSSAGDLFAYTFQVGKRAHIVGNTPSSGMAGTVSGGQYILPNNAFIQVPTSGFYDESGKFAVEGTGVVPDVKVPVTVQSLLSPADEVLDAAVASCKVAQ